MQSPPSGESFSSSRQALCGGCAVAGCSLDTLHWLLATGRDYQALWMLLLRMLRATFGSSKVSMDWGSAQVTSYHQECHGQG